MSFIPQLSASSVVHATLTRIGKYLITANDDVFKPVYFACSDDDILYPLLDVDNVDQNDADILALPISEPSTNENNELIYKVWVDNTFENQRFVGQEQTLGQKVLITSNYGDIVTLHSDDTSRTVQTWITTINPIGRPYIAENYKLDFTSDYNFFTIEFTNPPKTDVVNNNYDVIKENQSYIFTAVNKDGSGKYTGTMFGSPSIVFNIRLIETEQLFSELQKSQNRDRIYIPNFLTVTQIDSARTDIANVQKGTISLEVINIINK